jgi:hypothetical protein
MGNIGIEISSHVAEYPFAVFWEKLWKLVWPSYIFWWNDVWFLLSNSSYVPKQLCQLCECVYYLANYQTSCCNYWHVEYHRLIHFHSCVLFISLWCYLMVLHFSSIYVLTRWVKLRSSTGLEITMLFSMVYTYLREHEVKCCGWKKRKCEKQPTLIYSIGKYRKG